MKASNTLTKREKQAFSVAITGDKLQNLIRKSVATPEAAARLTATLISAVAASQKLQDCNPALVVAAALQGEGEGLVYGREYSIIPFGEKATFVRGWRGYLSLLYATGEIADTDCFEVRSGELVGKDKRKKRPVFDFSVYETDEEANKHEIIGYYFFVEYLDGRFVYEYMSVDEILRHADTYVPYFSLSLFNKWKNGEDLTPDEFKKFGITYDALMRLRQTGEGTKDERKAAKDLGAWYDEGMGQVAMMKKTVILKLMRSGRVRLANSATINNAVRYDTVSVEEPMIDFDIENTTVVESTGGIIDVEIEDVPQDAVDAEPVPDMDEVGKPAPAKRGRKKKDPEPADEPYDDYEDSFFGEV